MLNLHPVSRRFAGVAALAVVSVFAVACSTSINVSTLEGEVAAQVAVQQGVPASEVTVDCPDAIELAAGTVTRCSATVAGAPAEVEVTQLDDAGRIEWVLVTPDAQPAP